MRPVNGSRVAVWAEINRRMEREGERERLRNSVLFQHSVYGDYQCEVDGWINSRLEWMVIARKVHKGNSLGNF